MLKISLISAALFSIISYSYAQNKLDEHSQEALRQTMQLLTDQQQRGQSIQNLGQPAKRADEMVDKLAGDSQTKQEIYELAALVMQRIVQETNGDVGKLEKMLEQAANNPEAFAKNFSPAERKKLKQLAAKIRSRANNSPRK